MRPLKLLPISANGIRELTKRRNPDSVFFDPATMKWWRARCHTGWVGKDGRVWFSTSERGFDGARCYTVRRLDHNGRIETVNADGIWTPDAHGSFITRIEAQMAARALARQTFEEVSG